MNQTVIQLWKITGQIIRSAATDQFPEFPLGNPTLNVAVEARHRKRPAPHPREQRGPNTCALPQITGRLFRSYAVDTFDLRPGGGSQNLRIDRKSTRLN